MEHVRLVGNGAFMHINITVEDRHALASAYSYNRYYKLQPAAAEMPEDVCNEDPEIWKQYRNEARKTGGPRAGRRPERKMRTLARLVRLAVVLIPCTPLVLAQPGRAAAGPADLQGVYQAIPDPVTLPGGLKNLGSPAAVALLPEAAHQAKSVDLKKDPWKMCQPVGSFRMMAKEQTKIELVPVSTKIVMLFEDLSHAMRRSIYLKRSHPAKLEPIWMGDSVGRWEGDTLVVDTTGFNDSTWLNDEGAQHSDALHLVERVRPVLGGQYLEYKMTAEDTKALAKPYT